MSQAVEAVRKSLTTNRTKGSTGTGSNLWSRMSLNNKLGTGSGSSNRPQGIRDSTTTPSAPMSSGVNEKSGHSGGPSMQHYPDDTVEPTSHVEQTRESDEEAKVEE